MAAPQSSATQVRQVEVRPLGSAVPTAALDAARGWLEQQRASQASVEARQMFVAAGHEFALVACGPVRSGVMSADCELKVSTMCVPALARLQLTCLQTESEVGVPTDSLFCDFVRPQLLQARAQRRLEGISNLLTLELNKVWVAGGREFGVRALDPDGRYGVLNENTEVFVQYVETRALNKVHVLPYDDTLPAAYSVDLFKDFLQPFFQAHPFEQYGADDIFAYGGVRFRVVATDPPGLSARIGTQTIVFSSGEPLRPTIWDRIPPELQEELRQLPRGLQLLMLNTMAGDEAMQRRLLEVDQILQRGQGLDSEAVKGCGRVVTWSSDARASDKQQQCMVCLGDFVDGEELRELPCGHHFHIGCVDEWLQRSALCPICKREVSSSRGAASGSGSSVASGAIGLPEGAPVLWGELPGVVVKFDGASQIRVCLECGSELDVPVAEVTQPLGGVRLFGLSAEDLNGKVCRIVGLDTQSGRYKVQMEQDANRVIAVRPDNLILPTGCLARVEGLAAGGSGERWNARYGRTSGFDETSTRHTVQMQPGGELIKVRPKNLRV